MSDIDDKKLREAICYIYGHIEAHVCLVDIAKAVGLSVSSLQRLFKEGLGQSPGVLMRRLRIERACRALQSTEASIIDIALDSGYEDHAAFSRRFRRALSCSPSEARRSRKVLSYFDSTELKAPIILDWRGAKVQGVTEVGVYFDAAPRAWDRLSALLTEEECSGEGGVFFIGIAHDNPHEEAVDPEAVRFTAAVAHSERSIVADAIEIPPGWYAQFCYVGQPNTLGLAYHYIYGEWALHSDHQIDTDRSAFQLFECIPASTAEQEILIHVPLRG